MNRATLSLQKYLFFYPLIVITSQRMVNVVGLKLAVVVAVAVGLVVPVSLVVASPISLNCGDRSSVQVPLSAQSTEYLIENQTAPCAIHVNVTAYNVTLVVTNCVLQNEFWVRISSQGASPFTLRVTDTLIDVNTTATITAWRFFLLQVDDQPYASNNPTIGMYVYNCSVFIAAQLTTSSDTLYLFHIALPTAATAASSTCDNCIVHIAYTTSIGIIIEHGSSDSGNVYVASADVYSANNLTLLIENVENLSVSGSACTVRVLSVIATSTLEGPRVTAASCGSIVIASIESVSILTIDAAQSMSTATAQLLHVRSVDLQSGYQTYALTLSNAFVGKSVLEIQCSQLTVVSWTCTAMMMSADQGDVSISLVSSRLHVTSASAQSFGTVNTVNVLMSTGSAAQCLLSVANSYLHVPCFLCASPTLALPSQLVLDDVDVDAVFGIFTSPFASGEATWIHNVRLNSSSVGWSPSRYEDFPIPTKLVWNGTLLWPDAIMNHLPGASIKMYPTVVWAPYHCPPQQHESNSSDSWCTCSRGQVVPWTSKRMPWPLISPSLTGVSATHSSILSSSMSLSISVSATSLLSLTVTTSNSPSISQSVESLSSLSDSVLLITAQVAIGGSSLAGDNAAVATIAVLLVKCGTPLPSINDVTLSTSPLGYFSSPFRRLGVVAGLVGNLLIVAAIFILNGLVVFLKHYLCNDDDDSGYRKHTDIDSATLQAEHWGLHKADDEGTEEGGVGDRDKAAPLNPPISHGGGGGGGGDQDNKRSMSGLLKDAVLQWPLHGDRMVRFPSWGVRAVTTLLPMCSFYALSLMASNGALVESSSLPPPRGSSSTDADSAGGVVLGLFGVLLVAVIAVGVVQWLLVASAASVASYDPHAVYVARCGDVPLRPVHQWIVPRGAWFPEPLAAAAGPLLSGSHGSRSAAVLYTSLLLLNIVVHGVCGIAATVGDVAACRGLIGALGVLLVVVAVGLALTHLRIFRLPHDGVLKPIQFATLGSIAFVKAAMVPLPDALTLTQAILVTVATILTVYVAVVFRLWRPEPEEDVTLGGRGDEGAAVSLAVDADVTQQDTPLLLIPETGDATTTGEADPSAEQKEHVADDEADINAAEVRLLSDTDDIGDCFAAYGTSSHDNHHPWSA